VFRFIHAMNDTLYTHLVKTIYYIYFKSTTIGAFQPTYNPRHVWLVAVHLIL